MNYNTLLNNNKSPSPKRVGESDCYNTITIYTTGLSNGLHAMYNDSTEQNIAKIYNDLKLNLFDQISDRFNIIIRHYDPILINENFKMIPLQKNIDYLNNVSKDDETYKSVISSEFILAKLLLIDINIYLKDIIISLNLIIF